MGDLSKHFSRWEFKCKGENCCGGSAPVEFHLLVGLEELRERVSGILGKDTPLSINSGFRCVKHNKRVGGAENSQHLYGTATDIKTPEGLTDDRFALIAGSVFAFARGGVGIYNGRIHVDVRGTKARWDKR